MRIQSPFEEKLNSLSHALGIVFGIIALVLFGQYEGHNTPYSFIASVVYSLTIIILFTASTLYHAVKHEALKHKFRILDHIGIYLLIAGTYTPICLVTLESGQGWIIFYAVWGIALFGTLLKLFFTGRFEIFSTILYLIMGWLIVLDFENLKISLQPEGLQFMFIGGMAYTLGIVFYSIERIPYNHFIWHLMVLTGAVSHFFMIYLYVI